MAGKIKKINIQYDSFADGMNNADQKSEVGSRYLGRSSNDVRNRWKQIVDCLDLMLHSKKPRPAVNGFCDTMNARCRGLGIYRKHDGTEYLLGVYNEDLVSINESTGEITKLFDIGGDGEAWFQSYLDKAFVCNGTNVVKVEGTTAYKLGIVAPSGVTASAVSGGSLPDGVYKIYVSYSRGTDLFSTGQAVADVTCGSGSNTIRFADFAASSDAQVTKKTVWMTDAGGSVYYLYHQQANEAATTFDITDATGKNTSYVYSTDAQDNDAVPAFEYIKCFNNYLYGTADNVLYRSLQVGNVYDLERFDTAASGNKATYPYNIEGIFEIGADLYLNTPGGIIKIPNGDYNNVIDIKQGYFDYPRTVVEWDGGLFGLTKNGFRIFDGERMHQVDVSRDIKPVIDTVIANASSNYMPSGCLVRDNDRMQYWCGYIDTTVGTATNNRSLVLNMDELYFTENKQAHAPWEKWSIGFNYMVKKSDETFYGAQSHETKSIVFKKYTTKRQDQNVYDGNTLNTTRDYGWTVTVPTIIPDLQGRIRCHTLWVYAQLSAALYAKVVIDKAPVIEETFTMDKPSSNWDELIWDEDEWAPEGGIDKKKPLKANLKGKAVYITFYQTARDDVFELMNAILECSLKEGRFA